MSYSLFKYILNFVRFILIIVFIAIRSSMHCPCVHCWCTCSAELIKVACLKGLQMMDIKRTK